MRCIIILEKGKTSNGCAIVFWLNNRLNFSEQGGYFTSIVNTIIKTITKNIIFNMFFIIATTPFQRVAQPPVYTPLRNLAFNIG